MGESVGVGAKPLLQVEGLSKIYGEGEGAVEALHEIEGYVRACQDIGVIRRDDELLQSIAIASTIHGFLSLLNDGRIEHLLEGRYSIQQVQDFVLGAIFSGVGEN